MTTSPWLAGLGRRSITPSEPMLLAGYAGNSRFHTSVSQPICARALVCQHGREMPIALLALDLCGVDEATVAHLRGAVLARWGLAPERLIVNCSHNHSGPNVDTTLSLYYAHGPELDAQIARYTDQVREAAIAALADAFASLAPATLGFEQGLAGFAVNRRRSRPGCRHLPGPVDHDVPVLAVRGADGALRGVAFTYACHTTSLGGRDLNGDYAGYACAQLEQEHAGATCLFLAGCGANQNPLPRYKPELSRAYGLILAEAVKSVLARPLRPLEAAPHCVAATVPLPLDLPPPGQPIPVQVPPGYPPEMDQRIRELLAARIATGTCDRTIPYRLSAWRFGDELTLLGLTGETIVEYALAAKEAYGWDTTWVLGYCDHLTPYIPTRRVLREGGYEGDQSMAEYGYAAPFTPAVETTITRALATLMSSPAD
jgi:hypothetical protein